MVKRYTMKHVLKNVYGLWPSINSMAISLNESPTVLEKAMKAGRLPDKRHDEEIILNAGFIGSTLTHKHLKQHRKEHQNEY